MKLSWLLQGSGWRLLHVRRCRECSKKFADTEPGCWTDLRDDEFPQLCHCQPRRNYGHTNCRAFGPYCPPCAVKIAEEQREMDRNWR